eukprot:scaffold22639_cov105-Cylindrotheca_fusiformis.AAC.2
MDSYKRLSFYERKQYLIVAVQSADDLSFWPACLKGDHSVEVPVLDIREVDIRGVDMKQTRPRHA